MKADYFLARGTRLVGVILPVELVAEFDRRIAELPYRPRSTVVAQAIRHFLECPAGLWENDDQAAS